MAITIQLATFSKRENSTAQYAGTWTDFSCTLKENCSVINPRVELHTATNVTAFNYAYISAFNRYYFIRDIEYYREETILYLECDVLATYKSTIGSSTEYVLRSASASDGDIVDGLYPTNGLTDLIIGDYTATAPFSASNITSVIGIINVNQNHKFGAAQLYTISESSLGSLMSYLLGATQGGQTIMDEVTALIAPLANADVQNAIARSLINPAQYITESYMLPYTPPTSGPAVALKCGWYSPPSGVGKIITSGASEFFITSGTLTLPDHPQASTRGGYLNLAPYMKYWLYLGCFGLYPIDANTVYSSRTVTYSIDGDINGNLACSLFVDGKQIDILRANVKCSFPVGQTSFNVGGAVQSALGAGESAVRIVGGDSTGIVSGASNILNAVQSIVPNVTKQGTQGTFNNVFDKFYAYGEAHYIVDEDNTHRGRPYCRVSQISNLSGYILVSDADISIAGTKQENEQIKSYMNSGFYYE